MIATQQSWVRVTKRFHCPICESDTWCMVSGDGQAVICMRIESSKRIDCKGAGAGYLHRVGDSIKVKIPPKPKTVPVSNIPFHEMMEKYRERTSDDDYSFLANSLGVSVNSLKVLGSGYAWDKKAWAFPMYNSQGDTIGIRLRSNDGSKFAVAGSKSGLFIPNGMIGDMVEMIAFCEGPTDTAAMLDLGITAIGRPSCSGSVDECSAIAAGRDVVILADKDNVKEVAGKVINPGLQGAQGLAKALGKARSVKIIYPVRGKDIRQWKSLGCTKELISVMIRNTKPFKA